MIKFYGEELLKEDYSENDLKGKLYSIDINQLYDITQLDNFNLPNLNSADKINVFMNNIAFKAILDGDTLYLNNNTLPSVLTQDTLIPFIANANNRGAINIKFNNMQINTLYNKNDTLLEPNSIIAGNLYYLYYSSDNGGRFILLQTNDTLEKVPLYLNDIIFKNYGYIRYSPNNYELILPKNKSLDLNRSIVSLVLPANLNNGIILTTFYLKKSDAIYKLDMMVNVNNDAITELSIDVNNLDDYISNITIIYTDKKIQILENELTELYVESIRIINSNVPEIDLINIKFITEDILEQQNVTQYFIKKEYDLEYSDALELPDILQELLGLLRSKQESNNEYMFNIVYNNNITYLKISMYTDNNTVLSLYFPEDNSGIKYQVNDGPISLLKYNRDDFSDLIGNDYSGSLKDLIDRYQNILDSYNQLPNTSRIIPKSGTDYIYVPAPAADNSPVSRGYSYNYFITKDTILKYKYLHFRDIDYYSNYSTFNYQTNATYDWAYFKNNNTTNEIKYKMTAYRDYVVTEIDDNVTNGIYYSTKLAYKKKSDKHCGIYLRAGVQSLIVDKVDGTFNKYRYLSLGNADIGISNINSPDTNYYYYKQTLTTYSGSVYAPAYLLNDDNIGINRLYRESDRAIALTPNELDYYNIVDFVNINGRAIIFITETDIYYKSLDDYIGLGMQNSNGEIRKMNILPSNVKLLKIRVSKELNCIVVLTESGRLLLRGVLPNTNVINDVFEYYMTLDETNSLGSIIDVHFSTNSIWILTSHHMLYGNILDRNGNTPDLFIQPDTSSGSYMPIYQHKQNPNGGDYMNRYSYIGSNGTYIGYNVTQPYMAWISEITDINKPLDTRQVKPQYIIPLGEVAGIACILSNGQLVSNVSTYYRVGEAPIYRRLLSKYNTDLLELSRGYNSRDIRYANSTGDDYTLPLFENKVDHYLYNISAKESKPNITRESIGIRLSNQNDKIDIRLLRAMYRRLYLLGTNSEYNPRLGKTNYSYYIDDGGNDKYNNGNRITTNITGTTPIIYNDYLVYQDRYIMVFKFNNINELRIDGELGADGNGSIVTDENIYLSNQLMVSYKYTKDTGDDTIYHYVFHTSRVTTHNVDNAVELDKDWYTFDTNNDVILLVFWGKQNVTKYGNDLLSYYDLQEYIESLLNLLSVTPA